MARYCFYWRYVRPDVPIWMNEAGFGSLFEKLGWNDSREWFDSIAKPCPELSPTMKQYFEWALAAGNSLLAEFAKNHAQKVAAKTPPVAPLLVEDARMRSGVNLASSNLAALPAPTSFKISRPTAGAGQGKWSRAALLDMGRSESESDFDEDEEFLGDDSAGAEDDEEEWKAAVHRPLKATSVRQRRGSRALGPHAAPHICGREHPLLMNPTSELNVAALVWVKMGDLPWAVAQVFLERDVPAEYVAQVSELKKNVPAGSDGVLVLFFSLPSRNFGWALPRQGEIADFNVDWLDYYRNYAAVTNNLTLLTSLTFAQRTLMYASLESAEMDDGGWCNESEMLGAFDLGRLVWARLNLREQWFPASVTCMEEIPAGQRDLVLAHATGTDSDKLVIFFDAPLNQFGWIPCKPELLQPFRCLLPSISPGARAGANQRRDTSYLRSIRRALMYESIYVPSKSEGDRWACSAGCNCLNHPFRTSCFVCGSSRGVHPLQYRFLEVAMLGSRVYPSGLSCWESFQVTFHCELLPTGQVSFLYRSIGILVFALSAPLPFIALLAKHAMAPERRPEDWIVCVLNEALEPWIFVQHLRHLLVTLPSMSHVVTLEADENTDATTLFGHPRFFVDPFSVVAGLMNAAYAKKDPAEQFK